MILLRKAEKKDLDWTYRELKKFSLYLNTKHEMIGEEEYVRSMAMKFADEHIFLVAEGEVHGLMGLIIGIKMPHLFNPKIRTICIIVYWVASEYRKSRAGSMLLKEIIKVGREEADWISFAVSSNCPIKESTLNNLGFQTAEINHILEVT